jgi:predicted RNA methylase
MYMEDAFIVDAGCGSGYVTLAALRMGMHAIKRPRTTGEKRASYSDANKENVPPTNVPRQNSDIELHSLQTDLAFDM